MIREIVEALICRTKSCRSLTWSQPSLANLTYVNSRLVKPMAIIIFGHFLLVVQKTVEENKIGRMRRKFHRAGCQARNFFGANL